MRYEHFRRPSLLLTAALVAVTGTAFAQNGGRGNPQDNDHAQDNSSRSDKLGPAGTTGQNGKVAAPHNQTDTEANADHRFLMQAALGNMNEIQMAQMAQKRSRNTRVTNYAQTLIEDHTNANNQVMQIARQKGITLSAMTASDKASMTRMAKLSGSKFDRSFLQMSLQHHKKDIAAYQQEAARGYDDAIKTYAASVLPNLQTHQLLAAELNNPSAATRNTVTPGNTNNRTATNRPGNNPDGTARGAGTNNSQNTNGKDVP